MIAVGTPMSLLMSQGKFAGESCIPVQGAKGCLIMLRFRLKQTHHHVELLKLNFKPN